jgi:hypothetical protein
MPAQQAAVVVPTPAARPTTVVVPSATAAEPLPFHQPPPPPSPYAGPPFVDPAWFAQGPGGSRPGGGCPDGRCTSFLRRVGMYCWSHHTLPTCSSGPSECTFIFGSCRSFYGEPCLSSQPLVPVPPGYEPFRYGQPPEMWWWNRAPRTPLGQP